MKTVLVFGTFDLLHPGHLDFFRQAKLLGDRLVVVVGTDKNVARIKGDKPVENQETRMAAINKRALAAKVLLAPEDYSYIEVLKKEMPTTIALGYDQKPSEQELQEELIKNGITAEIVRLKPFKPDQYKSSLFRVKSI